MSKRLKAAAETTVIFAALLAALWFVASSAGYAPRDMASLWGSSSAVASSSETPMANHLTPAERAAADAAPIGAYGEKTGAGQHARILEARWAKCRPVPFVLNTTNAPAGAVDDFRLALTKLEGGTSLDLQIVGTTASESTPDWHLARDKNAWRPVLITWDSSGRGILDGDAAATAVPGFATTPDGVGVIVSGQITFNLDRDHRFAPGFGPYGSRVALYMHEVAHILGLDHVDDNKQLMYGESGWAADAGAGDLAGLAQAAGPCVPAP